MSANVAHQLHRTEEDEVTRAHSLRVRIVLGIGPVTVFAGIAWALVQPWRLTILHPAGQGFWWLFAEPPLFVVLVGVLFRFVIVPGLVDDMEAAE